jgi:hypothetical protein
MKILLYLTLFLIIVLNIKRSSIFLNKSSLYKEVDQLVRPHLIYIRGNREGNEFVQIYEEEK